jgi:hypothetical protein
VKGYELDPESAELVECTSQVRDGPSEAVEAKDHHRVERPAPGVCREAIKSRPALSRARAFVDILLVELPASALDVLAEPRDLHLVD